MLLSLHPWSAIQPKPPSDYKTHRAGLWATRKRAFYHHLSYVTAQLLRLMKPGRLVCVHSMDLPTTQTTHGVTGLRDFTGTLIRHYVEEGFVYHGRITIDRCPQGLAIRRKSKQLLFVQMDRDCSWLRRLPGFILVFRTPARIGASRTTA